MVINAYVLAAEPSWIESSLTSYYAVVDRIVVSYDRSGRGWTGAPIPIDECLDRLRSVDPDRKMQFCPGDHAFPGHTPMENDTRQRQQALEAAEAGADWVLAIDTDEVLPDALAFARHLAEVPETFRAVEWPMRSFFRRMNSGRFLEVCTPLRRQLSEYPGCVAVRPGVKFTAARRAQEPIWRFDVRPADRDPLSGQTYTPQGVIARSEAILHFSWARTEADLVGKLKSWSHSGDFDWRNYLERVWRPAPLWWPLMYHFHPIWPRLWPALRPVQVRPELTDGRAAGPGARADATPLPPSEPVESGRDKEPQAWRKTASVTQNGI
jgi:hypothetical protein